MMGKEHLLFGTITSIALAGFICNTSYPICEALQDTAIAIVPLGMLGSLMPDIDHPNSMIGKHCLWLSNLLYKIFGHRTITHDLFLTLILTVVSFYKLPWLMGFWFGYLGHLLLDGCTVQGIKFAYLFYRGNIYFVPRFLRVKANGIGATFVTFFATVACTGAFFFPYKDTILTYLQVVKM